jgi:hypothetical protein
MISQNICLSLDYGTIDKFTVQVPWLQLHTGQVNVFIDTVVLIFKLSVVDADNDLLKSSESFTQELKRVRITCVCWVPLAFFFPRLFI